MLRVAVLCINALPPVTRRAKAKLQDGKPQKPKTTENEAPGALSNTYDSNFHNVIHDEIRTLLFLGV